MIDKNSSIKVEIIRCRKLIEQQLNWASDFVVTRREYEILVEKIFEQTGVLLSISTIRRIWNNDFKNLPHKSTLDALAVFAGFSDWQEFIELQNHEKLTVINQNKRNYSKPIFIALITIILMVIAIVVGRNLSNKEIEIAGPVLFEYYQESDSTIPNIIVFDYDVRNIVADSFFIVESSNDYHKKKLSVLVGNMTSSYYQPGNYEAFLLADDSVVMKLDIEIMSNSWLAMVRYQLKPDNVPYYFYEGDIIFDDKISVSREMINNSNIAIVDDLYLTLSNTFNLDTVTDGDFIFETRVKLDSVEINLSCPKIYVGLIFEKELCYIPLVHYGGQDKLQVKYGRRYLTSNDSDLSGYGCNIYSWQDLRIESNDSHIEILLNDKIISSIIDSTEMGFLRGFSFTFDGIGSVKHVSMIKNQNDTIYYNSFEKKKLVKKSN